MPIDLTLSQQRMLQDLAIQARSAGSTDGVGIGNLGIIDGKIQKFNTHFLERHGIFRSEPTVQMMASSCALRENLAGIVNKFVDAGVTFSKEMKSILGDLGLSEHEGRYVASTRSLLSRSAAAKFVNAMSALEQPEAQEGADEIGRLSNKLGLGNCRGAGTVKDSSFTAVAGEDVIKEMMAGRGWTRTALGELEVQMRANGANRPAFERALIKSMNESNLPVRPTDLAQLSVPGLMALAQKFVDGTMNDAHGLELELNRLKSRGATNVADMMPVIEKFDQASEEEKARITFEQSNGEAPKSGEQQVQAQALLEQSIRTDVNELNDEIEIRLEPAEEPGGGEPRPKIAPPRPQDYKNFAADLVFDSDTAAHDSDSSSKTADQLRAVLGRHRQTLAFYLCNPEHESLNELPETTKMVLESFASGFKTILKLKDKVEEPKAEEPKSESLFGAIFGKIGRIVKDVATAISTDVPKEYYHAGNEEQVSELLERNVADLSSTMLTMMSVKIGMAIEKFTGTVQTAIETVINAGANEQPAESVADKMVSGEKQNFEALLLVAPGVTKNRTKNGMREIAINGKDFTYGQDSKDKDDRQIRQGVSSEILNSLLTEAKSNPNKGTMGLLNKVLKRYFKDVPMQDRRAMVAAALRYGELVGDKVPGNKRESVQQAMLFGALLKGAGPVLQKMMQGLVSNLPDETMREALADIRSNLAPIDEHVVKANLHDMIQRSNGDILLITVKKSLGAASVGQAFLCDFEMRNPEDETRPIVRQMVVKMLRPDALQRIEREKDIFMDEARKMGDGMDVTFAGQLESILSELDLRQEAENTEAGRVYDAHTQGVKSMKLLDGIEPTRYTMVAECAPGMTVDKLLVKVENEMNDIATQAGFLKERKVVDAQTGKVRKEFEYTVPNAPLEENKDRYLQCVNKLNGLYERLLVHQQRLIDLAEAWVEEGVFKSGFYHGDLHAGNIMVDDDFGEVYRNTGRLPRTGKGIPDLAGNKGLTVIDFGNVTKLTAEQQKNVIRMISSASFNDVSTYMEGLYGLLSEQGKTLYRQKEATLRTMLENVFNLGTERDAGQRIALSLEYLTKLGFEVPAPIHKFSECQMRLHGTIQQVNEMLSKIKREVHSVEETIGLKVHADFLRMGLRDEQKILHPNVVETAFFMVPVEDSMGDSIDELKKEFKGKNLMDGFNLTLPICQKKRQSMIAWWDSLEKELRAVRDAYPDSAAKVQSVINTVRTKVEAIIARFDMDLGVPLFTTEERGAYLGSLRNAHHEAAMEIQQRFGNEDGSFDAERAYDELKRETDAYVEAHPDDRALCSEHDLLHAYKSSMGRPNANRSPAAREAEKQNWCRSARALYALGMAQQSRSAEELQMAQRLHDRMVVYDAAIDARNRVIDGYAKDILAALKGISKPYTKAKMAELDAFKAEYDEADKHHPTDTCVHTMFGAVGKVLENWKLSAVWKLGLGTTFDMVKSGKLWKEQISE